MKVIKPLGKIPTTGYRVFLAGSIEMGAAINWQDKLTELLSDTDGYILNPRRDDWDSSWEQSLENAQFRNQVQWELKAMELADRILMYFDPATKSPISLMELGMYCSSNKLVVCCPDGFWRKGNVDVVCERYRTPQVKTIQELAETLIAPPKVSNVGGDDA